MDVVYGVLRKSSGEWLLLLRLLGVKGRELVFEPPGGKVEEKENLQEACEREFFEETGLRVKVVKYLGKTCAEKYNGNKQEFWHFFLVEPIEHGEIKTESGEEEEFAGFAWALPEKIPEKLRAWSLIEAMRWFNASNS